MSYLSCDNKTHYDITNLVVHRVCLETQKNYYLKNEFLVNANLFEKFYSELATNLLKELLIAPIKLNISTNKDYYPDMPLKIFNNKTNEIQLFNIYKHALQVFFRLLKYD